MSDIVERLRHGEDVGGATLSQVECREMAAEIERLRKDEELWQQALGGCATDRQRLEAEIARLQTQLTRAKASIERQDAALRATVDEMERRGNEIERLRALIDELYGWVSMENRGRALAVVKEALERHVIIHTGTNEIRWKK